MCEQSEINYLDGEVVWVKLGSCWWPGEVVALEKLPPDVVGSFRKPPIACVKFFQEDAYEYVKNINNIYKYNCSRKNEFITKGLYMFRTKHGHMEKFPEDVIRAETTIGGDIDILTREEFQQTKKESYAGLFGDPKKTPGSMKKGKSGKGRPPAESSNAFTPLRQMREKADYKVHILVQGSKLNPTSETPTSEVTPSSSSTDLTAAEDKPLDENKSQNEDRQQNEHSSESKETSTSSIPLPTTTPLQSAPSSTAPSSSGIYACHACPFTTSRLNVLILHNKTHSVSFVPYTPSPVRKKQFTKSPPKSTPNSSKTPKPRKPRKEANKTPKKEAKKRASEEKLPSVEVKKPKTDEEIKSSLLADWDDDVEEDSNDEATMMVSAHSPEIPVGAESPAVPTPAELPSAQLPIEISPVPDKKSSSTPSTEKPESSSDSKYEFCEDEDWPEEADFGRKIPRVKNPIRTEDSKSVGIDEDEMAREVAELLNKTVVPELPSVPEPLKIEENFPELSIVKSPDKNLNKIPEKSNDIGVSEAPQTKAIFKTKTFFRSRHCRSQDAIGKYVAEQLNAVERMDISENEINGSEAVSSPEARDSPPIEPVRVARLAPKIQLKKMKAEAAQLREKEKRNIDQASEPFTFGQICNITPPEPKQHHEPALETYKAGLTVNESDEKDNNKTIFKKPVQDVLYPTQEIKPLNADIYNSFNTEVTEEQLTNKHAFIDKYVADFVKESPKYERDIIHTAKSQFEKELTSLQDEKHMLEKDTPRHEGKSSKHEEDSPNQELFKNGEKTSRRQKETSIPKEETSSHTEEEAKYHDETSVHKEVIQTHNDTIMLEIDTPSRKEVTPILEEETLNPKEAIFTEEISEFEVETSNYEGGVEHVSQTEAINQNYEVEMKAEHILAQSQSFHKNNDNNHHDILLNQETEANGRQVPIVKLPEPSLLEKETHLPKINDKIQEQIGPYMNESTASAVDALLSVSREADRVPRVVSNDLPEDLFEDDNKDTDSMEPADLNDDFNEKNGTENSHLTENGVVEDIETEEVHGVESVQDISEQSENVIETSTPEIVHSEEIVNTTEDTSKSLEHEMNIAEVVIENVPTESDLQVAEALINLPSTAIPSKPLTEHKDSLIIPFIFDHENSQEEIVVPLSEPADSNDTEVEFQGVEVITDTVPHVEDMPASDSDLNTRFETEQEKCENLNAAQSLVQMSESIEHKINIAEQMDISEPNAFTAKQNNGIDTSTKSVEHNIALLSSENSSQVALPKSTPKYEQSSSKLLKMLEEPCKPKISINKSTPTKPIIMQGKEKILNFDVAKSSFKSKTPKQKIIIRRAVTPNKTVINSVKDSTGPEKIILSRSGIPSQEGSSMQTFTIQTSPDTPSDASTIIIQQKIRKISKPHVIQPKLQKIKPQTSLVPPATEAKTTNKTQANDDAMFDINSMPIVLSEDLLTPESIEKMPVVMSDGNIINQSPITTKVLAPKQKVIEREKVTISSAPHKSEVKTLLINPGGEVTKSVTPNILSKSTKLRGAKPMLVFDKTTGKQKIIMTKTEPAVKEVKQGPNIIQPVSQAPKTEKFIILPTQNASPRPARTQKIVIDPQTGKAHVFVAKGSDAPLSATENKPVSAKLMPSNNESAAPGNTVMIITNAQGAQSRIVLTPEHEKILFPNKQQPNISQLKSITHRITSTPAQKTVMTTIAPVRASTMATVRAPTVAPVRTPTIAPVRTPTVASVRAPTIAPVRAPTMAPVKTSTVTPVKAPTRIVPKQKSAIITSKGQLIVGGRVATTAQNIAPMPEMRTVTKRIVTSEPKKLTPAVQKTNSEPIIFLQQKSGAVMQLTTAQFEHLQRTGQIVQKTSAPVHEKIVIQKVKPANEPGPSIKSRARKTATESPAPCKKIKHEIAIAPAPTPPSIVTAPNPPSIVPALAPTIHIQPQILVPSASNTVSIASTSYSDFDNFEEMLPSTAIARQQEAPAAPAPAPPPPAPTPPPPPAPAVESAAAPAQLADGQIMAVPGEHFGCMPGTFYLCLEDNGMYTPIDNRPLMLENNQLVPMAVETAVPERRDILEAALANSDVFRAEPTRDDAPDFRDLNANVSVHCRVSETSSTLNQPIMTPLEMPSKAAAEPAVPASLEDGLAVIGVTPHSVPTSLELPITVTDPRIAPKTTDPLSGNNYGAGSLVSPGGAGPISMPLLTDEDAVGKSMPILTDEVTASSLGSAGSPASEAEEGGGGGGWTRRLLTPNSDLSETSAEIPLQPGLELSAADLADRS